MQLDQFQADNLANWSDRARVHTTSQSYNLARYAAEPEHISSIIQFDAPLLGEIAGLEPLTLDYGATYTDGDHSLIVNTRQHEWSHSFAQTINALIGAGLTVTRLEEHAGLDWPHVPSAVAEGAQYFLPGELRHQTPQMFSLWAERR